MSRKYAKGRHAVAECQRSGQKMRYRDLVEDGHVPGLLVHPDWWEPKHPQEIPVEIDDPIALLRPAPEISIEADYGDPEAPTPPPTGPAPNDFCTTAAQTVTAGATQVVLDQATKYIIGQWVFITLDGGGTFISRITTTADTPTFLVPFTSPFVGTATAGNQVCVGDGFILTQQNYTATVADYGVSNRNGYTVIGVPAGAVSPSPALLSVEDGLVTEFQEITFQASGLGVEFWFATGETGTNALATINFDTFSTIEVDYNGGTEVLDTREIGSGGDMNQGASTEGPAFSTFYFPNVAKRWGPADTGLQYQVRFIP